MIKFDTKDELKNNIDKYINNISNQIAMFESKQATLFMCLEKINSTIQLAENFDDPMMLVELLTETNDYVHIIKDYIHNYEILERKICNIKSSLNCVLILIGTFPSIKSPTDASGVTFP